MTADRGDINSWVQTYSGAQLRTFDRTITYTVNTYVRYYRFDSSYGGALRLDGRQYTTNTNFTRRYEYVNANNSLFNNYIDGGINSGQLMYAQDIVDTVEDNVRRAVDLIEGRISGTYQVINACHASCHSSCHTSRGRR
jgi:hypothetical protein